MVVTSVFDRLASSFILPRSFFWRVYIFLLHFERVASEHYCNVVQSCIVTFHHPDPISLTLVDNKTVIVPLCGSGLHPCGGSPNKYNPLSL